ncbi:MAG TPA: hypothetical protein VJT78_07335 [Candidatus Dormibacteraeota bacterium]|nr:hypothetical protein [Candidatus Dormibacteraeota bacterium]
MERPIVCTLDASDLADRGKAWEKVLQSGLVRRERIPGGLMFIAEPGAAKALAELAELERECCAWIDYDIRESTVTMTARGAGEPVLAEMFRLQR